MATHKKRRTAAQKRATAKMLAANRARRRRSTVHHVKRAARRYRRNPSPRMGALMPLLTESLQGALGAVVVNAAFSFLPLPATLKTGTVSNVTKGALAVGLGMLMPRNRMIAHMVKGSLTLTMYDAVKGVVGTAIPGMAGLGYYPGGAVMRAPAIGASPAPALSEYVNSGAMAGLEAVDEYVYNY